MIDKRSSFTHAPRPVDGFINDRPHALLVSHATGRWRLGTRRRNTRSGPRPPQPDHLPYPSCLGHRHPRRSRSTDRDDATWSSVLLLSEAHATASSRRTRPPTPPGPDTILDPEDGRPVQNGPRLIENAATSRCLDF